MNIDGTRDPDVECLEHYVGLLRRKRFGAAERYAKTHPNAKRLYDGIQEILDDGSREYERKFDELFPRFTEDLIETIKKIED